MITMTIKAACCFVAVVLLNYVWTWGVMNEKEPTKKKAFLAAVSQSIALILGCLVARWMQRHGL